jgi:hypothetical protein
MTKKAYHPEDLSADPAAQQMLIRAEELGLSTAFTRATELSPATSAAPACAANCAAWDPAG